MVEMVETANILRVGSPETSLVYEAVVVVATAIALLNHSLRVV